MYLYFFCITVFKNDLSLFFNDKRFTYLYPLILKDSKDEVPSLVN